MFIVDSLANQDL